MDAVGSAGVVAAPVADEFTVLEAQPVKELTEAQQIAALTTGLGLGDPDINDGRGINGFGDADGNPVPRIGLPVHAPQPGRIETAETKVFRDNARDLEGMGVEIKGGAKPLGNQAVAQAIQAQGVVFGPGGLKASNVVPLVGRGDRKPEDNVPKTKRVDGAPPVPQAKPPLALGQLDPAFSTAGPTTREELEAAKAALDAEFEAHAVQAAELMRQKAQVSDPFDKAYLAHPGEDNPETALFLTRGQVNALQRLLDASIPDARALIAAVALKASVEVAGIEGLRLDFTTPELAEIDRRASFWNMTRAQAVTKMLELLKPFMFDGSSMV